MSVTTVSAAFRKFRGDVVDLAPEQTRVARRSRDYLYDQICVITAAAQFPRLVARYLGFGSFARSTKIRPLDDIDILLRLNGSGTTIARAFFSLDPYTVVLQASNSGSPWAQFCTQQNAINSIKLLNTLKSLLATKVPNYRKAEVHRNQNAVTLGLVSYPWVFDIVPSIPIYDGQGNQLYFLIPDGRGNWIRTDPRSDDKALQVVNQRHPFQVRPIIRLLKYWNRRKHKPRLDSYYFEALMLNVFGSKTLTTVDGPRLIKYFFDTCPSYLWSSCPDPKGLGPNLDAKINWDAKNKIAAAMTEASAVAASALSHASQGNHRYAIRDWQRVFGPEFPSYGSYH